MINLYHRKKNLTISTINATTIDQSDVETKNVYTYVDSYDYKSTVSKLDGTLQLEGTTNNFTLEQREIGAKVTVTSYDESLVYDAPITTKGGAYSANGIKADTKPYTLKVDVPGHFTMYKSFVLSDEVRGETVGKRLAYLLPTAAAGDTNKDNVIDILDALAVQKHWGTNNASVRL